MGNQGGDPDRSQECRGFSQWELSLPQPRTQKQNASLGITSKITVKSPTGQQAIEAGKQSLKKIGGFRGRLRHGSRS